MDCKKIPPDNIIKLSASISLILVDKFDQDELSVIKNLLYSIANNISAYQGQFFVFDKHKKK